MTAEEWSTILYGDLDFPWSKEVEMILDGGDEWAVVRMRSCYWVVHYCGEDHPVSKTYSMAHSAVCACGKELPENMVALRDLANM